MSTARDLKSNATRRDMRDFFKKHLAHVAYKNWVLRVNCDPNRNDAIYLQWVWTARDAKTAELGVQTSRKWYVSGYSTKSELIQTAFKAALTAEEHECRESFTYQGKRVYGPHINVDALAKVADNEDVRE